MASDVATDTYLIQLQDIPSTKSTAGDLWQLSRPLSTYNSGSRRTDVYFAATRYYLNQLDKVMWEHLQLSMNFIQFFSEVDQAHFDLLLAVTNGQSRLAVFREKQELLKWAARLCAGCRVKVKVRNMCSEYEILAGVIRFARRLQSDNARRYFGIELDPEFEGKGTSNGEFKKCKYFECKEDCAVFVSVDKLEPELQSPVLSHRDNTNFSDQNVSSSSDILVRGRPVADMVQTCSLAINDRVVWMSDDGPEYGTVRWIGVLPDAVPPRDASQLTVGVEFDNPVGSGTGRYHSQTLFTARRRHASLIPIMGLLKESDLKGFSRQFQPVASGGHERIDINQGMSRYDPSNTGATNVGPLPDVVKQNETTQLQQSIAVIDLDKNSLTNMSSVDQRGCVLPPSVADADVLCSFNRGIQPCSNTCALEVIIFVLFAFYSFFDKQLFAKPADNLVGAVRSILVEQIVNPLRATYFVSVDKMRRFGDLFAMIQSAKLAGCATSTVSLSDDPSGMITTVLCDLLQVDPLITSSYSSSYVYDFDVSRTAYHFPSLQHIIECSVIKNSDTRLIQHPLSVFIVSVDSARFCQLVPCGRIFPGLNLDISAIMHFPGHLCKQCGRQGVYICGSCFTDENMREMTDAYKLSDYVFCENCFSETHQQVNKQDHHTLPVATVRDNSLQKLEEHSLFELFAIVSFVNGHYMSFVKVGIGDSSAWLRYDPMAVLGRSSMHNSQLFLPEITRCDEIETWLKDIRTSQRADTLPDVIVQITSGLHLCFYRPRR